MRNAVPLWFQPGIIVKPKKGGNKTLVSTIDFIKGFWLGENSDGKHYYPIDEVLNKWDIQTN